MFNWFKKKPEPVSSILRDVLFGDSPLASWPPQDSEQLEMEPWSTFVRARQFLESGNKPEAIQALREILAQPGLESRHYLQAWHFLREQDVQPDAEAKQVYGVVVEVALSRGLDIVAAYADHTARYFNFSGAAVIWDRPDNSLDSSIADLLKSGGNVVAQIGPWDQPRPVAPPRGQVRINMLTPSRLHFGQAEMNFFGQDALAGPVIAQATTLMQQLIAKTNTN